MQELLLEKYALPFDILNAGTGALISSVYICEETQSNTGELSLPRRPSKRGFLLDMLLADKKPRKKSKEMFVTGFCYVEGNSMLHISFSR